MKISEVYKKFNIPPNLQEHMLKVCSIVSFIEKHWTREEVNWGLAKKVALLHDIGNINIFSPPLPLLNQFVQKLAGRLFYQ